MNLQTETDHSPTYPFICPQCGCLTHGSPTSAGRRSTYCEDCTADRDIDDPLAALA